MDTLVPVSVITALYESVPAGGTNAPKVMVPANWPVSVLTTAPLDATRLATNGPMPPLRSTL